jgi:drug/metabolite transporter (DMT)-like permease
MPWFAHNHRPLYCLALLAAAVARRIGKKTRADAWLFGALALAGIYLAARPFMPSLQNNWTAYCWSLIALAAAGDDRSVGPAPALAGRDNEQ